MSRRPPSSACDVRQGEALAPIRITGMVPEDLAEITRIERSCFPKPWSESVFTQELNNPVSRIWVARSGGKRILGYICRWLVGAEVHILNLAVDPQARRRGIGRRLLSRVLREARLQGASMVWLEVRRGNSAAYWLYRRAGFVEVGERRNYYGRGEDAVVMRLDL